LAIARTNRRRLRELNAPILAGSDESLMTQLDGNVQGFKDVASAVANVDPNTSLRRRKSGKLPYKSDKKIRQIEVFGWVWRSEKCRKSMKKRQLHHFATGVSAERKGRRFSPRISLFSQAFCKSDTWGSGRNRIRIG